MTFSALQLSVLLLLVAHWFSRAGASPLGLLDQRNSGYGDSLRLDAKYLDCRRALDAVSVLVLAAQNDVAGSQW